MQLEHAVSILAALAQETRLRAFQHLVASGPDGLSAGRLASDLGVPPATLSFHLKEMANAGLVEARRESRSMIYTVPMAGIRDLIDFLARDCCQGRPDLCGIDLGAKPAVPVPASAPAATRPREALEDAD